MNLNQLQSAVTEWAYARNIIKGATSKDQCLKGVSEMGELCDALLKRQPEKIKDGIGDVIVVLTIIAEQEGTSLEECLRLAYDEIKDRKGVMYQGTFIKSTDERYASACAELGLSV